MSTALDASKWRPFPLLAICKLGALGKPCDGGDDARNQSVRGTVIFEYYDGVPASLKNTTTLPSIEGLTESVCRITWAIEGLTEGKHGFHIHEKADFSDGCKSAGPHWNPFGKSHGGPDDEERHAGDLGNIVADENGKSSGQLTSRIIALEGELSVVGRSVMVHADEDDLGRGDNSEPGTNGKTSKTTGNAGARVACGKIVLLEHTRRARL